MQSFWSAYRIVLSVLIGSLLAGCSVITKPSPTPLPTIVLDSGGGQQGISTQMMTGGVTASGVVAPAQEAQLVFTLSGKLEAVEVQVGDTAKAGQELARLAGQEDLQAAISEAEYQVVQAQQALDDLSTQAEIERVQSMQDIITFEKAVRDAQYALDNFTIPSNQANLDTVEALALMKQQLDKARLAFEPYKYYPSTDSKREDLKEALDQAQADYNSAVKRLQYEYDLQVASEQLARAQHDFEILKQGPDPEKVRLAQADLDSAQNQLQATRAALANLKLAAPFDGTVVQIYSHSGEWVVVGSTVISLADLTHLQVKTTDLSELDIPQVMVGQSVQVIVKALGQNISGRVIDISPLASSLGGDVVYQTTIALDTIPEGLRAGMSVEVQFGTD
jgi:multidrug efflux pump subunit AcrA (membrane-fusion protein)